MTEAVHQILSRLDGLSHEERAELAYALLQSLDAEDDPDAATAWEAELSRRTAEIRSGIAIGTPAAEVFSKLSKRRP